MHAGRHAHRRVVVPKVEKAAIGGHQVHNLHGQVLLVVGQNDARIAVFQLRIHCIRIRRGPARIVLVRELARWIAGELAIGIGVQVGRAERVPATIAIRPGLAAQRRHRLRPLRFGILASAVARCPDPIGVDDPFGVWNAELAA